MRVGAIGLACVFLLVMLATALLHVAGDADLANHPAAAVNAAEPAEPLAQMGLAPGNAPADDAASQMAPQSAPQPRPAAVAPPPAAATPPASRTAPAPAPAR